MVDSLTVPINYFFPIKKCSNDNRMMMMMMIFVYLHYGGQLIFATLKIQAQCALFCFRARRKQHKTAFSHSMKAWWREIFSYCQGSIGKWGLKAENGDSCCQTQFHGYLQITHHRLSIVAFCLTLLLS